MKKALTIAGFDPTGGAGIQADLKVFGRFGVYGLSVVSSLTAQNSSGVEAVMPVEVKFFEKQIEVLLRDMRPDAFKTGMLYGEDVVGAVSRAVKKFDLSNFVIDPVMISSSGRRLAEKGAFQALVRLLLPLCSVVTPNIAEAEAISSVRIECRKDMEQAARKIMVLGARAVVITGGHLEKRAVDLFYDGEAHYMGSVKIGGEYHGTGCTYSAAVTALLAKGSSPLKAAEGAKRFMKGLFARSFNTGAGMSIFDI